MGVAKPCVHPALLLISPGKKEVPLPVFQVLYQCILPPENWAQHRVQGQPQRSRCIGYYSHNEQQASACICCLSMHGETNNAKRAPDMHMQIANRSLHECHASRLWAWGIQHSRTHVKPTMAYKYMNIMNCYPWSSITSHLNFELISHPAFSTDASQTQQ